MSFSFVNLADGSPALIRRDTEQGYVGVGVPAQQVCSGNLRVKIEYVWFRPVAAPPKRILQLVLDLAICSDCEPLQTDSRSCYVPAKTFHSIPLI